MRDRVRRFLRPHVIYFLACFILTLAFAISAEPSRFVAIVLYLGTLPTSILGLVITFFGELALFHELGDRSVPASLFNIVVWTWVAAIQARFIVRRAWGSKRRASETNETLEPSDVGPGSRLSVAARPRWLRAILMMGATAGAVLVFSTGWGVACDPLGLGGNCMPWVPREPFAEDSLIGGGPPDGFELPHDRYTADYLNRQRREEHWTVEPIRYVNGDTPSTDPTVVSVNPIDRWTWAAAAYDLRRERCYVIRWDADHENPEYGGARYDVLDKDERCVASAITADSAMRGDWPFIQVKRVDWIVQGGLLMGLGLLLSTASHAIALRSPAPTTGRKRTARNVLFVTGAIALGMGLVPLLEGL